MELNHTQAPPAIHARLAQKIEKLGDRQEKWLSVREKRASRRSISSSGRTVLNGGRRSFVQDGGQERRTGPDKHTPPVDDTSMAGLELTAPRPSVGGGVFERELNFEVEEDSDYSSIQV